MVSPVPPRQGEGQVPEHSCIKFTLPCSVALRVRPAYCFILFCFEELSGASEILPSLSSGSEYPRCLQVSRLVGSRPGGACTQTLLPSGLGCSKSECIPKSLFLEP